MPEQEVHCWERNGSMACAWIIYFVGLRPQTNKTWLGPTFLRLWVPQLQHMVVFRDGVSVLTVCLVHICCWILQTVSTLPLPDHCQITTDHLKRSNGKWLYSILRPSGDLANTPSYTMHIETHTENFGYSESAWKPNKKEMSFWNLQRQCFTC